MTIPVEPHTNEQPGLRGHSHDPENDLLKQFVIVEKLPTGGNLWVKSFDTQLEADWFGVAQPITKKFKLIDQFDNNRVIWEENFKLDTTKKS